MHEAAEGAHELGGQVDRHGGDEVVAQRDPAQADDHHDARRRGGDLHDVAFDEGEVDDRAGQRAYGVEVAAPEYVGDAPQAHVAHQAAAHARDDAHEHAGDEAVAAEQRLVGPAEREQGDRDDVEHGDWLVELVEQAGEEEGGDAHGGGQQDGHGVVEHVDLVGRQDHVADQPAAQGGDQPEDAHPDDVEALVAGLQRARNGAGDHGPELEERGDGQGVRRRVGRRGEQLDDRGRRTSVRGRPRDEGHERVQPCPPSLSQTGPGGPCGPNGAVSRSEKVGKIVAAPHRSRADLRAFCGEFHGGICEAVDFGRGFGILHFRLWRAVRVAEGARLEIV